MLVDTRRLPGTASWCKAELLDTDLPSAFLLAGYVLDMPSCGRAKLMHTDLSSALFLAHTCCISELITDSA